MIKKQINQAILFDLDGTLVDTALDFFAVADIFCDRYAYTRPANQLIEQEISNGSLAITELLTGIKKEDNGIKKYHEVLLSIYAENLGIAAKPYPGIEQLLELFNEKKIPWGVVTNKPLKYSQPLMENLGLYNSCQTLICPDHVKKTKPDPEPINLALKQLQCHAEHSLYIGDHKRDIIAGRNAQTKTIAAAYGYLNNNDQVSLWQADFIAHSSAELYDIIYPLIQS